MPDGNHAASGETKCILVTLPEKKVYMETGMKNVFTLICHCMTVLHDQGDVKYAAKMSFSITFSS